MTLDRVRWSDAIEALEERYGAEPSPAQAALLADASSLSALFEDEAAEVRSHHPHRGGVGAQRGADPTDQFEVADLVLGEAR